MAGLSRSCEEEEKGYNGEDGKKAKKLFRNVMTSADLGMREGVARGCKGA